MMFIFNLQRTNISIISNGNVNNGRSLKQLYNLIVRHRNFNLLVNIQRLFSMEGASLTSGTIHPHF